MCQFTQLSHLLDFDVGVTVGESFVGYLCLCHVSHSLDFDVCVRGAICWILMFVSGEPFIGF